MIKALTTAIIGIATLTAIPSANAASLQDSVNACRAQIEHNYGDTYIRFKSLKDFRMQTIVFTVEINGIREIVSCSMTHGTMVALNGPDGTVRLAAQAAP